MKSYTVYAPLTIRLCFVLLVSVKWLAKKTTGVLQWLGRWYPKSYCTHPSTLVGSPLGEVASDDEVCEEQTLLMLDDATDRKSVADTQQTYDSTATDGASSQ